MTAHQSWIKWFLVTSQKFAWFPVFIFGFHVFASQVLNAYYYWPDLDVPMHFMGGFSIAYFLNGAYMTAERLKLLGQPAMWLRIFMVFALASTTTIFWEFAEFSADFLIGSHMIGGLNDTLLDMLLGMSGAGLLLLLYLGQKPQPAPSRKLARR